MRFNSLLLLCHLAATATSSPVKNGLTIQTTSGQVHGFINQTAPLVRQFLGIPYAEPPTGERRFLPPVEREDRGSIKATAFAPSCMQQESNSSTIYTEQVSQFLINGGQSEDCLYLNIWAPATSSKKLPVFVYIPGGGFTSGGADSLYKIPDKWIQRTQSHIVVALNYRVNIFGFPNAKGLDNRNVGLLDQRMAVEWTRNNIEAFGGDPSRITLWGQSAGGASTDLFGYAYPDDPIVTGLICDSGSATIAGSSDYTQKNFTFIAEKVGCAGNDDAVLECMRGVPATRLRDVVSTYGNVKSMGLSFTPIPDNITAFSNTTDRALRGLVADIPAIFGSNANEGAGFVSLTGTQPPEETMHALTQSIIACPSAREVHIRELAGLTTYRYYYTGNFSNISPWDWMGAYHSSELPLLFGTHDEYRTPSTEFEYQLSYAMEALWLSFASNPQSAPSYQNWSWPEYKADVPSMVQFPSGDNIVGIVSGNVIDGNCTGV
ncbi:hypothetical protein ASPWEDRAFT_734215 [Aspergillus wentii DTO 134E9]|uniref:Carboxylic ester hydrolase n=1 Tax=Aspergillus wentii DTO 134E9 TaxID=1073089 RepID=A0A1L9RT58_ASPWE|nr:uncharacterized protein ASPWEDRAFT_734215 [Aspergillus wentii DTO 134E9]OJJ38084.1 hypothetical protein ASPWEDRAFT_734215 [Aspergillus wentii DTO 134E9]